MDKKKQIKLIAMAVGSVLAIALIVFGFQMFQGVFSRAADVAPRNVIITDIKENSARIVWETDQETQGVVEYGTSPTQLNFFTPEMQKSKDHKADVTLLSPGSTYYFQISIGDKKYDNGGVPWSFMTKSRGADAQITKAPAKVTPSVSITTTTSPSPTTALIPSPTSSLPTLTPTSFIIPTYSLTLPTNTPTPIPTLTPTPTVMVVCGESDCQKICQKAMSGTCSTQDFIRSNCLTRVTWGSCVWITPTLTPTLTPTPTP